MLLFVVMIGAALTLALVIRDDRGSPKRSTSGPTSTTTPSTSTRPSTTTTTAPPTSYEVQAGESLSGIARRFGVSLLGLAALNNISDPNRITPHQMLRLPRIRLAVDPTTVTAGRSVSIRLTGAGPAETITFTINSHTGAPHTASSRGTVTATYRTAATDPIGPYHVTVDGSQGSRAQATFTVEAPAGG